MSITATFRCDGCSAEAAGARPIRREFYSFNGSGYGFGAWKEEPVSAVTPEGWVAFDPHTSCCYCPTCWQEIETALAPNPEPSHE